MGFEVGEGFQCCFFLIGLTIISPTGLICRIAHLPMSSKHLFCGLELQTQLQHVILSNAWCIKGYCGNRRLQAWELDVLLQQTVVKRLRLCNFKVVNYILKTCHYVGGRMFLSLSMVISAPCGLQVSGLHYLSDLCRKKHFP